MSDHQQAPATQNLAAVITVLLNSRAYSGEDEPNHLWEMTVNPWVWRISATTAERYPDAASAQAAAAELLDALVDASQARMHDNGGETRQGVIREVPYGADSPVFRGFVEVPLHA